MKKKGKEKPKTTLLVLFDSDISAFFTGHIVEGFLKQCTKTVKEQKIPTVLQSEKSVLKGIITRLATLRPSFAPPPPPSAPKDGSICKRVIPLSSRGENVNFSNFPAAKYEKICKVQA